MATKPRKPVDRLEPPLDPKAAGGSIAEHALIDQLDTLQREGEDARALYFKGQDLEDDIALYRGVFAPDERKTYYALNFIQAFIDRMVAELTDNRPILRVEHRKAGLKKAAAALEKTILSLWNELDVQRQTFKMCENAAVTRAAGLYTGYDPESDSIYLELLRNGQVVFSPEVYEAAYVDRADYVMIHRVRTLDEIRRRFPVRGSLVRADTSTTPGAGTTNLGAAPLDQVLRMGGSIGSSDALPRAVLTEVLVKDRQTTPDGRPLFPNGRRIIRSKDTILWDGPNTYWDGLWPVDWFDWVVDPQHPYGSISECGRLKRSQLSFNEIMDGLVENQILSNVMTVVGDYDAITPKQWGMLQKLKNSLALAKRNRNATLEVKPPPEFGASRLAVAKSLFTYAQVVTGVTDATLGENPGSLQSGVAIEGLQEGAKLMNRARASRLEDFFTRVGNKLVARIFQFMTSDRIMTMLGPTDEAIDYAFNRAELFLNDDAEPVTEQERENVFKYMRFAILPGSSAPGTRAKRAEAMVKLHMLGAASRKMVLQAGDFQDPDQMLQEAEADFAKFPPPGFQRVKQGAQGG